MERRVVQSLNGVMGWVASCTYVGMLHMGPFYYAVNISAGERTPRLSRIAGLQEACL